MINLKQFDDILPAEQCSRTQFAAQRDKLAQLMRSAGEGPAAVSSPSSGTAERDEVWLERDIEQRLQRLIVRAKGIVSEKMLVRHQREIPVDEIPDYAVTHLLAQLGEQELKSQRR